MRTSSGRSGTSLIGIATCTPVCTGVPSSACRRVMFSITNGSTCGLSPARSLPLSTSTRRYFCSRTLMAMDRLTVAGSDLRIMVYTAEPGTEDAERLALLTVLGTQSLVE